MVERKRALAAINAVRTRIEKKYGVQVQAQRRAHESGVGVDRNGNRVVRIGLADCPSVAGRGDVREIDFVYVMLVMRHEERHLEQLKDLAGAFQPGWAGWDDIEDMEGRDRARRVRDCGLVNGAMPGFHDVTYFRNFVEQDAELCAIEDTRSFFSKHYPEIDVDGCLVEIVRESQHWYGRKAATADGLETSLKAYLDGDAVAGAYEGICDYVPKRGSGMMTEFKADPARVAELAGCRSVEVQMNMLLRFVISMEREKLKDAGRSDLQRTAWPAAGAEDVSWRVKLEEKAREERRRKAERDARMTYSSAGTRDDGGSVSIDASWSEKASAEDELNIGR